MVICFEKFWLWNVEDVDECIEMDGIVKWIYIVNFIGVVFIVRMKSKDIKIVIFDMICRVYVL